jgi:cation diffusion facilitator CzcD-associated flavoprotein CzcO
MDISSELSQRPLAQKLFISLRRGVWVFPKYIDGQPADKAVLPPWMPPKLGRSLARSKRKKTIGKMEDYGLPKPDHEPLDAQPSVSGEVLTRVGCGDIIPRPGIERLDGDGVIFTDGTREQIDAIVWATGYNLTFPFFQQDDLTPKENVFPLYKRMFKPGRASLFFVGLAQPLPTLVNFAEQQSKLVAAALGGQYHLPPSEEMQRVIDGEERHYLGHFYDSARHRMQVEFYPYVADLMKEIERGAKRAKALA